MFAMFLPIDANAAGENTNAPFLSTLRHDFRHFYSDSRLRRMGVVFGGAAIFAHSALDEDIQEWYQQDVRTSATNWWAKRAKILGEGKYLLPLSLIAASSGLLFSEESKASMISKWGERTARAYLVGGLAAAAAQRLTGASRPGETKYGSSWKPFNDDNGVSGHAFIGAVPFLTVAKMCEDKKVIKSICYLLSSVTAWSRINDNAHYTSQAALGWYLAWEATDAVHPQGEKEQSVTFVPIFEKDGLGLCFSIQW